MAAAQTEVETLRGRLAEAEESAQNRVAGLEQADYVLTALSWFVALATIYRALVYRRSDTGPSVAGPLVAPSEEVQRSPVSESEQSSCFWPGVVQVG